MHHPPVRPVIIHRKMLSDAVVPERHVVLLPAPADAELRPRRMGEQQLEQRLALQLAQLIDPRGEPFIDEQRLAAALRVRTNNRV
ncbi:hypothetical protein D3C79_888370 [compost metagenome]